MRSYVIAGGGIAGISAAEAIRLYDKDSPITLIAPECVPLYSRPLVSMVLEGEISPAQSVIRTAGFYEKLGIRVLKGQRLAEVDATRGRVRTTGGKELAYDRLLIATGAEPRRLEVPGASLPGVFYLRTMADAQAMVGWLKRGVSQALVLGGGLVGFKAAYALMRRGLKVTMLIRSAYPLSMQVDERAGAMVRQQLEKAGLEVKVGVEVEDIRGKQAVEGAKLSDGQSMDCQMIVVGKGVVPAVDFEGAQGLKQDRGVLVDRGMRTSLEGVYAAGDVAQGWDLVWGEQRVNAIWPVAVEQGRVAGANMAGADVTHPGAVGRNVIRIFGLDVMSAGIVTPPRQEGWEEFYHYEPEQGLYRKVVVWEGRVMGMVMVGEVHQGGVVLALMQRAQPLPVEPERLIEPGFNLARLME